jgi:hypothetical protein
MRGPTTILSASPTVSTSTLASGWRHVRALGGRVRRRTNHEINPRAPRSGPGCLDRPHQAGQVPGAGRQNGAMVIVCATSKLLDRLGPPTSAVEQASTTLLGDWYATALFWRPQVALLVSEVTLLPVLMPLAPAATLLQRFGPPLAAVLDAHGTPAVFIDAELQEMGEVRLARTASRSVVGIMNEFTYLADALAPGRARPSRPCRAAGCHALRPSV